MPKPETLDDLFGRIKDIYINDTQYTVPGQAAVAVIAELSLAEVQELVSSLNAQGIKFDLRRNGYGLIALSIDMPEFVLRLYLVEYFASILSVDLSIAAKERGRLAARTMQSGYMLLYSGIPAVKDDGSFYFPDPESGE